MRKFVIVLATAGVALANYGTPLAKDDYDDDSYTKGNVVSNAVNSGANEQSHRSGDVKPTYPTSYGFGQSQPTASNDYRAPGRDYGPVVPQPQAKNNAMKSGASGRSSPRYTSAARLSARPLAGFDSSNRLPEPAGPLQQPYSFAYTAEDEEGSHSHSASSDAQGRVSGEYTIKLADGRNRVVKYTSDERGYRADIITNELGTESKNPADVTIQSSAITGEQAALQFGQQYQRQTDSGRYTFERNARQDQPTFLPPTNARSTKAATVQQIPLRHTVEQVPQRASSDSGARQRNKPSYG